MCNCTFEFQRRMTSVERSLEEAENLNKKYESIIHEGKVFKCNICRNTFVSRRKLKQHMENSHNKKENKTPSGYGTVINID